MVINKLSLALVLSLLLATSTIFTSYAQNLPADYVNVHNSARTAVSVAAITWDTIIANYAINYANQRKNDCNLQKSGGPYGENLVRGFGVTFTGTAAVNQWVNQGPYYNHTLNTCIGGGACLDYTQVVWSTSVKVGCARVQCLNGWTGWYFVICSYDLPGNQNGQSPY